MLGTVYASKGGNRYHKTATCPALKATQRISAFGEIRPRVYPPREVPLTTATGQSKEPCSTCFPGMRGAWYRTSSENDYGHEPIEIQGDDFCQRCRTHGVDEDGEPWSYPTLWPCTSAVVLGLTLR